MSQLADFLILGEMKCGTTTLWKLLAQDRRVFFPSEKELHFFGSYSYFGASGPGKLGDLREYAKHFASAQEGQVCGEATPNYLVDRLAPQRIYATYPSAKLIAILRDPAERAWSHYWHLVRRGWETLGFEEALDAEEERLARGDDEREKFSYLLRGRYVQHLKRYESLFGRQALCVVFLDEVTRNRQATAERVWRHIGCEAPHVVLGNLPHSNRASYPKWRTVSRLTQGVMRWARARGGIVLAAATSVRKNARPLVYYEGRPRMSERIQARLQEEFKESNRELAKWLDRPVPWVGEESKVDIRRVAKNHTPIGGPADE